MRAMRNLTLAIVGCGLVAVGCGSNPAVKDMSIAVDMAPGPDMAMRVPNGVACGTNVTCAVGKDCCVSFANNMATGAMCVDTPAQCQGALLACDGPEDCNMSATDACCATINLKGIGSDAGVMVTGGNSKCGQCAASVSLTGTFMTKLCHVPADCTSFSATVPIIGKIDFNKCCSNGMGGVQFCAPDPSTLGAFGGGGAYTCQ
jgi:hypothetical protein